jgi:hypothetical protein
MFRSLIAAASLAAVSLAVIPAAHANDFTTPEYTGSQPAAQGADRADQDRLMIISRNTGRVIYDDGRNDMYCVTQRYVSAYDYYGRPIMRRSMRCR